MLLHELLLMKESHANEFLGSDGKPTVIATHLPTANAVGFLLPPLVELAVLLLVLLATLADELVALSGRIQQL